MHGNAQPHHNDGGWRSFSARVMTALFQAGRLLSAAGRSGVVHFTATISMRRPRFSCLLDLVLMKLSLLAFIIFCSGPVLGIVPAQQYRIDSLMLLYIFCCDDFRFCGCADRESSEDFLKNTEKLRRLTSTCKSIDALYSCVLLCWFELNPTQNVWPIPCGHCFRSFDGAKILLNSQNICDCVEHCRLLVRSFPVSVQGISIFCAKSFFCCIELTTYHSVL